MTSFLRLTLLMLGLFSLLVGGALAVGCQKQSNITTYFHENEGIIYPLRIIDTVEHVQLLLAGTRCFGEVPTQFFTGASLNPGRWFTLDDASAVDAVLRLKCSSRNSAHLAR